MSNPIGRAWGNYGRLQGASREFATLALSLAFALFILPVLIWLAGKVTLGDYARSPAGTPTGGPLALWLDFVRGLASGSLGYWTVLLGPYVILVALRVTRGVLKR